jgi:uncharacterized membrane protein YdjX (TVP38/TMEM64 family)
MDCSPALQGRKSLKAVAFPLFLFSVLAIGFLFRGRLEGLLSDREGFRAWLSAQGFEGWLVFIGLQILQVVIFIIPGEITQAAGGFAFGFWQGSALSVVGIALGSMCNYFVGIWLGRPFVRAVLGEGGLARAELMVRTRKSEAAYFLLFVVPGLPKDALCYFAGMAKAPPVLFLGVSMLARIPGIAGSSLMGSAAYEGRYAISLWILALSALVLVLSLAWRKPIEAISARVVEKNEKRQVNVHED